MDAYHLKECANDCGYMFVAWSNSSKFCNKCGGYNTQSRVCRAGGGKTDFAVLVELARAVLSRNEIDDGARRVLDRLWRD